MDFNRFQAESWRSSATSESMAASLSDIDWWLHPMNVLIISKQIARMVLGISIFPAKITKEREFSYHFWILLVFLVSIVTLFNLISIANRCRFREIAPLSMAQVFDFLSFFSLSIRQRQVLLKSWNLIYLIHNRITFVNVYKLKLKTKWKSSWLPYWWGCLCARW